MTYDELTAENSEVTIIERHFDSDNIKGLYFNGNIALSSNLKTSSERLCILAEELGHHYTSVGNIIDMNDADNRKQEYIARLWGYNKLIGLQGLIDAFEHHCQSRTDVAEYLGVTEEFLIDSINAYMHKYGNYVKYGEYVIEFNYNSVGVMKTI